MLEAERRSGHRTGMCDGVDDESLLQNGARSAERELQDWGVGLEREA